MTFLRTWGTTIAVLAVALAFWVGVGYLVVATVSRIVGGT